MPADWPDLPDLLTTVGEFLADLSPRLDERDRYHALCARYLLEVAGRELDGWAHVPDNDDKRLRSALKVDDGDMEPAAVVRRLSAEIRDGLHDEQLPELMETLLKHVEAKVRISRPDYLREAGPELSK